jgi:hypothetical protein
MPTSKKALKELRGVTFRCIAIIGLGSYFLMRYGFDYCFPNAGKGYDGGIQLLFTIGITGTNVL